MLAFLTLFSPVLSQTCSLYKCRPSSIHFPDRSYCIHTISNTYYIDSCSSPYSCQTSIPYNETKCTYLDSYLAGSTLPGDSCLYNSDCYSNNCQLGFCVGLGRGSLCKSTRSCDVGLFCNTEGFCQTQITIGSPGCNSDYDCANTGGCQMKSKTDSSVNVCAKYFSLPNLSSTISLTGMLCQSAFVNGTNCVEAPVSSKVPKVCTTSSDCASETGGYKGVCSCGYNSQGIKYCSLFAGDSIAVKANEYLKKWVTGTEIEKSHSYNRLKYEYILKNWGMNGAKLVYYNTYYHNFASYYQTEDCVLEVFGTMYLEAKEKVEDDESDWAIGLVVGLISYLV